MTNSEILNLTPENIADYGVCGYKDANKHKELQKKIEWYKEYYPKGLRIKIYFSKEGGYQGMIEYIPGKYAHRPVNAEGYMFIHCVFVGFKKEYKAKGYATALLSECIKESQQQGMKGVVVVTRKGSFMVDKPLFLKNGFKVVDSAKPDFELIVKKFDEKAADPSFKKDMTDKLKSYQDGLYILRSPQCPYTEKNVAAILKTAQKKYKIKATLIELKDATMAQETPAPFGTFIVIYNGEIVSYHPISNTRFENIMNKKLQKD